MRFDTAISGKPAVSVVVSFYNKIDELRMILAALERQSFASFEVVIADDGSRQSVVDEIRKLQQASPFPIQHLWQEDRGFRKTAILNEALRKAKADYMIFIDGDCLPHRKFVEEHYAHRQAKQVLAGRRVNLSPRMTAGMNVEKIRAGLLESAFFTLDFFADSVFGKTSHAVKGLYVRNRLLRNFLNRKVKSILGCNFSIHRQDLLDINGFDERYKAPAAGEDCDIEVRLRWNNVAVKMVKNMAVQYHLHHQLLERSPVNDALFEQVKSSKQYFTPYGLNKAITTQNELYSSPSA
ncbi:MAG TPA: glycosyltransferase [Candidatus Acidoferrum sp.]|nr:glycosyltransferase [Candidatus Acidoferrum sp.]